MIMLRLHFKRCLLHLQTMQMIACIFIQICGPEVKNLSQNWLKTAKKISATMCN